MHSKQLTELRAALDAGVFSATELAHHFLARIQSASSLNAFLDVNPEPTLKAAAKADKSIAQGTQGPLTGIPIAHKDIFVTRDWRTTAASKMLEHYRSPFDATAVTRLADAGMVCLGKTNLDEFAMGSSNEDSFFGPVLNPWDCKAVPGGSSGGSAAAVAAGLAPAATGTDTGGSIRQPAALTGITGLKPSYGRISRYGMIAFASSLDQAGPMARSAEDCALLLGALAGHDEHDSTTLALPTEDFTRYLNCTWQGDTRTPKPYAALPDKPLAGLRIGLPKEYFSDGLHAQVGVTVHHALKMYESLGATLIDLSLPNTALSIPVYYVIAPAEASSNLARFDGVRYGYRAKNYGDLSDMYKKTRAEGFGPEVKRRLLTGTYVLSQGYYDAYYVQAQKIRRIIALDFEHAFTQCDVLMGPTAPNVAWNLGEKERDPVHMYLADIYTLSASLAGLPGMSIPCGFGEHGRPLGLQLIGPHLSEARLLQIAHAFQRQTDWHTKLPAQFA